MEDARIKLKPNQPDDGRRGVIPSFLSGRGHQLIPPGGEKVVNGF